jgi:cell division protein FtsZ
VVTKPFEFEGRRGKIAEEGLAELAQQVDSLIVILNEKLMEVLGEDVSMLDAFKSADNVLKNAVGGIAEIINVPGLVNVDFEDVRTVMGEMGKAMMGSAAAAGVDRARIAAESAVASPLLEGIELSGAKGVLVNITASASLGLKEYKEVMATIRNYTAPEATVICGAVFDDTMEDSLRVTVVATGLGSAAMARRKPELKAYVTEGAGLRTGTDNLTLGTGVSAATAGTATMGAAAPAGGLDDLFTSNRTRDSRAQAMSDTGMDKYDIPAFLRKQAD